MKFGRLSFILGIFSIFFAIYQHNLIIKLNYARQRLEMKKERLFKERDEVMRTLYQVQEPRKAKAWARECKGMQDTALSCVFTVTTQAQEDFFVTSTTSMHG